VHGRPLVYLDNAATAQKPQAVIDAVTRFYAHDNSNIHRGLHELSERSTAAYEAARGKARLFLNAAEDREIVFVRGTTEAINLVAQSYGRGHVAPGDEVVLTTMEHHSNIVPWQLLCEEKGARLRVAPIDDRGEIDLDAFERLLGPRTRLVSGRARVERPRHHQPGRTDHGTGAPSRRVRRDRRRAGRSASSD